jgi:hypothetical protein
MPINGIFASSERNSTNVKNGGESFILPPPLIDTQSLMPEGSGG